MSEINVTPLVDVMLVLLIIFMISAPLLTVGVPVELPKTEASAMPEQDANRDYLCAQLAAPLLAGARPTPDNAFKLQLVERTLGAVLDEAQERNS